jgi:hypothetical protein
MSRITDKDLTSLAAMINRATGSPADCYGSDGDKVRANIGNFHISHAYGGVSLHQMATSGGGVHDVFRCGHITKRELYIRMNAYLDGLNSARGQA